MRYLTPLLPRGEIFQSNCSSKSLKVSLVKRSSSILGCEVDFRQPSSMTKLSPGGDFLVGSSHPANVLPSNSSLNPAALSSELNWLSAARAPLQEINATARALTRMKVDMASILR